MIQTKVCLARARPPPPPLPCRGRGRGEGRTRPRGFAPRPGQNLRKLPLRNITIVHSFIHRSALKRCTYFSTNIPDKPLTNIKLARYAQELEIPHFRGVFMRDTLAQYPFNVESGIVNLIHLVSLAVIGYVIIGTRTKESTLIRMDR